MILLIIMLAISLNIDSLGVGISYGIRNIKIPLTSKIILCLLSIIHASIGLMFGKWLMSILPIQITNILGGILLISMGIWIVFQSLFSKNDLEEKDKSVYKVKKVRTIDLYIAPLKLTIKIIKDPVCGDIDNSNIIDAKEAFFLGVALSLDSLIATIGSGAAGVSSFFIPFMIGIFQMIFLTIGTLIGRKLSEFSNINKKVVFVISGILLIAIGIIRLI
ncbi:MAG: sporulation membrane protein YtaF [Bacilli bacterium]|nr:sporulation membrane protein YtaF [Bacilli bacterium]